MHQRKLSRNYEKIEAKANSILELEFMENDFHKKAISGDLNNGLFMMGQSAGLIKSILSLEEIMKYLVDDALSENNLFNSSIDELKSIK